MSGNGLLCNCSCKICPKDPRRGRRLAAAYLSLLMSAASLLSYLQDLLPHGPAYNLSWFAHSYFCAAEESLRRKMPSLLSSLWSVSKAAFTYAQLTHFYSASPAYGGSPPVCSNPGLSCQNTAPVQDTCCFNSPGGQLLQTQFWDTNPPTGPVDSWTIHGLWSVPSTLLHLPV